MVLVSSESNNSMRGEFKFIVLDNIIVVINFVVGFCLVTTTCSCITRTYCSTSMSPIIVFCWSGFGGLIFLKHVHNNTGLYVELIPSKKESYLLKDYDRPTTSKTTVGWLSVTF